MDLRVIVDKDGEEYINAKDLSVAMQKFVWKQVIPSVQVMSFVRRFIIEYITARR